MDRQEYEKIKAKIENLEKAINGGKGSGNWGHAGRPGEIGGSAPSGSSSASIGAPESSASSTIGKRFDRKARVKELELESREGKWGSEEREQAELAYDLAYQEDKVLSQHEVERGKRKKAAQDTPGKAETLQAKEEWEAAVAKYDKAKEGMEKVAGKWGTEEYGKASEKRDKAYKKLVDADIKLNKNLASQMTKDKTFVSELTKAIESGLNIKLEKPLTLTDKSYNSRDGKTTSYGVDIYADVPRSDLGAFSKVLRNAKISGGMNYSSDEWPGDKNNRRTPRMWGGVSLRYESMSGGENGQNVAGIWYYPDGTYDISDRRGDW